jgi:TolB-like protein
MSIWSAEIKELEKLYVFLKGQFPELEKELGQLIKTEDANVILLYSRRCLEVIITDLCECELKRDRGTEPLKGIIDKLNKEKKIPPNIIASIHSLNELSTFGTHPKDFDPEQVKPVLVNLDIIIKWYLKYKEPSSDIKVKPTEVIKHEIKSTGDVKKDITISKKKLAGLLSGLISVIVVVFVVLYLSKIIGNGKQTKELDKSIAVLPFYDDSPNDSNNYVINGLWAEVINKLQSVKDLRVLGRTSVEQYRNNKSKSNPEIAKELGVTYIVEGGGQLIKSTFRLRVNLINAKGKETPIWARPFEQEIKEVRDYTRMQSNIAQSIASELKATITPEEKKLIEKIPTANLTAYDFYQRGKEEENNYRENNPYTRIALEHAVEMYNKALEYDPFFAKAYTGLASVYRNKHYWEGYFTENFIDSVLILTDKALSIDDQLFEAYIVRGNYYRENGIDNKAIEEYDKALEINPNSWEAFYGKGNLYMYDDLINWIDNLQIAASLNRNPKQLPILLGWIGYAYIQAGFPEKADYYYLEAYKLNGDSVGYLKNLYSLELLRGNEDKGIELLKKAVLMDSTTPNPLNWLGERYLLRRQYRESLRYYRKYVERIKTSPEGFVLGSEHRIGLAYWENGDKKEGEFYFNKQIEDCNKVIKLGRFQSQKLFTYYDLAAVYAFLGEREKAYENLKVFNQRKIMAFWASSLIKVDPLFDSIRNEPEFQQIVRDIETKYQAEHERVRKWLEEQGI